MNYLFFGLGSIGQRHLRNLLHLDKKAKIFAVRKKYKSPLLDNNNNKINGSILKKYNIKNVNNLKFIKKKETRIDAAFICTPSSLHVKQASWCIKNDINIFIEKPVATNIKDLVKIKRLIKKNQN